MIARWFVNGALLVTACLAAPTLALAQDPEVAAWNAEGPEVHAEVLSGVLEFFLSGDGLVWAGACPWGTGLEPSGCEGRPEPSRGRSMLAAEAPQRVVLIVNPSGPVMQLYSDLENRMAIAGDAVADRMISGVRIVHATKERHPTQIPPMGFLARDVRTGEVVAVCERPRGEWRCDLDESVDAVVTLSYPYRSSNFMETFASIFLDQSSEEPAYGRSLRLFVDPEGNWRPFHESTVLY